MTCESQLFQPSAQRCRTALAALLCAGTMAIGAVAVVGCERQAREPRKIAAPQAVMNGPTAQTQKPSVRAKNGETAARAARRLFPEEYALTMEITERPQVLKGATVGVPRAVNRDYHRPGPILASWIMPRDATSAETGMFRAMRPAQMSDSVFIVPMVKKGRSVCEFTIELDAGRWSGGSGLTDPLPGGEVHDVEKATDELRRSLGKGTEVRLAIFLPSGLVFAVGRNSEREAAVYLTFNNAGPGVGSFDKYLPETGRLFTPAQLAKLLTP